MRASLGVLPTSPLPVSPEAFATSVGTWLALAAVGAFAAIVIGFLAHRREMRRAPEAQISTEASAAARDRLSA